jgi:hypothetical protein
MTRKQLLDMQQGFSELRTFELQERRAATPAMRMRQLDAIWKVAVELGVPHPASDPERLETDPWPMLRNAIYERSRSISQ